MSLGIYPVFKPALRRAKVDLLGEALAQNLPALEKIAAAAGIASIADYADNREVPDDFDGPPDELEEVLGPWDEWFDAADGQAAVEALLSHLAKNTKAAGALDDAKSVKSELEELVRVLALADKDGVQFRLEMG